MTEPAVMTWRDGVQYWRAWARIGGGITEEDDRRINGFYDAVVRFKPANLDETMPIELVKELRMDR